MGRLQVVVCIADIANITAAGAVAPALFKANTAFAAAEVARVLAPDLDARGL